MSVSNSASGHVEITKTKFHKLNYKENVYIAILLRSTKSRFNVEDWYHEMKIHKPIETGFEPFHISKKEWFSEAKIFVVPTLTFGKTFIEIKLNEHAWYGTGFTVELYHRTGIIEKVIKTTDEITTSLGGTIKITVQWQNVNKEIISPITFKTGEYHFLSKTDQDL